MQVRVMYAWSLSCKHAYASSKATGCALLMEWHACSNSSACLPSFSHVVLLDEYFVYKLGHMYTCIVIAGRSTSSCTGNIAIENVAIENVDWLSANGIILSHIPSVTCTQTPAQMRNASQMPLYTVQQFNLKAWHHGWA